MAYFELNEKDKNKKITLSELVSIVDYLWVDLYDDNNGDPIISILEMAVYQANIRKKKNKKQANTNKH